MRDALGVGVSLAAGIALARYHLNTDDTGIQVGLLLIAPVVHAVLAPRRWWLEALWVGLPSRSWRPQSRTRHCRPRAFATLGVANLGALTGFGIARASRAGAA